MNRPSYKELWLYEHKDRDEQLQWIRNAVNGEAEFCNSEPPYSEEEELARKIMQMHARIDELERDVKWREESISTTEHALANNEDDIEMLESRIAELEEKQRWIPVSERLPEANKCVLVYDAGGNMTVDFLVTSGGVETYFWLPKYRILFWMPLPELPKERE